MIAAVRRALLALGLFAIAGCAGHDAPNAGPSMCAPQDAATCALTSGCADGQRADANGACVDLGWSACGAGFMADSSGHGCREVLPANDCAAGTMPVLGMTTCVPVAASACATGFARDASGWGCDAVIADASCADATAPKLGQTTCAPIGDCTAAFPPASATLFVDATFAGAQIDATHFATVNAAIAAASDGAIIAVASGTYTETIAVAHDVSLVGRCAAQTLLASPSASTSAGIAVSAAVDVSIAGITFAGHASAIAAASGARVNVSDVVVDASRGSGMTASGVGTTLTIDRSVVRATIATSTMDGMGITASGGAALTMRDTAVVGNVNAGVRIAGTGTSGDIERSLILETAQTASGDFGNGLIVRDAATATVTSSAIAKNYEVGVLVYGAKTSAILTDVVIGDTANSVEAQYGRGLLVDTGSAVLTRVAVRASHDVGIVAEDSGSVNGTEVVIEGTLLGADGVNGAGLAVISRGTASLTSSALADNLTGLSADGVGSSFTFDKSIVTDTKGNGDGTGGSAVTIQEGSTCSVTDSALVRATGAAFYVTDVGTKATLASSVVSETVADLKGVHGRALSIQDGGAVTLSTSAIIANHDIAISVRGAKAKATIDHVVVRGTLPQADGTHGRGIEIGSGGQATITNVSLLDNHEIALFVVDAGSTMSLENGWIEGTLVAATAGGAGRAVTAQDGAAATLLGVIVEKNIQIGVASVGAGASLVVQSSRIDATLANAASMFGHGALALDGASMLLDDVTVENSAAAGLIFSNARGVVRGSRVNANAVGIAAQDGSTIVEEDAPPDTAMDEQAVISSDTTFVGNATRVSADDLPVPSPLGS